ncbi:prefoldin subunit 4 [Schizosaccharomyces japonicus yFS275]|uniref:Prefoldin subunit 4 n=1 Tax=Schizosaccharomyces japonicus (strain yFS275 / FY16936) TaxID=402676 RepID=B6JVV7_SCHJY|nr:prefoldin subunit 4 [Schizosaccharomyces japonicus yFS275]EEB05508.1 prefoldin subunit 4 [Schizosaccharomyces japonicus yFS275]
MSQVAVTKEDQALLNEFSVLHARHAVMEMDQKKLKTQLEDVVDATNECELLDEDDVDEIPMYKVGDAFFKLPLDKLNEHLEQDQEQLNKAVEQLDEKMEEDMVRIKELKTRLYSKFHDQINLD